MAMAERSEKPAAVATCFVSCNDPFPPTASLCHRAPLDAPSLTRPSQADTLRALPGWGSDLQPWASGSVAGRLQKQAALVKQQGTAGTSPVLLHPNASAPAAAPPQPLCSCGDHGGKRDSGRHLMVCSTCHVSALGQPSFARGPGVGTTSPSNWRGKQRGNRLSWLAGIVVLPGTGPGLIPQQACVHACVWSRRQAGACPAHASNMQTCNARRTWYNTWGYAKVSACRPGQSQPAPVPAGPSPAVGLAVRTTMR